jgi:hypothetical protein
MISERGPVPPVFQPGALTVTKIFKVVEHLLIFVKVDRVNALSILDFPSEVDPRRVLLDPREVGRDLILNSSPILLPLFGC